MKRPLYATLSIIIVCTAIIASAHAKYPSPIRNHLGITANFGQFRSTTGSYQIHDGMDYYAMIGTKLYPVFKGAVKEINNNPSNGWGKYVIIESSDKTSQARYAHMSEIYVKAGDEIHDISIPIGASGNTGPTSTGAHLHFSLGDSVRGYVESNPVTYGLEENYINYRSAYFNRIRKKEIRSLKKDEDIVFVVNDGDSSRSRIVDFGLTNQAIKIVCEAYQKARYHTNPYAIKITVKKSNDTSYIREKIIEFSRVEYSANKYYRINPPLKSIFDPSSNIIKNFYEMEWVPEYAGTYEVEAKVYIAYWENGRLIRRDAANPEAGQIQSVKRTIEIADTWAGLIDSTGMYAWQPSSTGIAAAGVINAAGIAWPSPRYVTDLSNTIFTNNISDVDPQFQKYTDILVAAYRDTNWTLNIKDSGGRMVDKIEKNNIAESTIRWEGRGLGTGIYKYEIVAKDPLTGIISTKEGISEITIDNEKPQISVDVYHFPTKNTLTTSSDSTAISLMPQEDLFSIGVNIVDAINYDRKIVSGLGWSPNIIKGETFIVRWDGAGAYPDGAYRFEVVLTDMAGNTNIVYSNPVVINKSGSYISPVPIVEPPPRPSYPSTWRLPFDGTEKSAGIAVDNDGNIYMASPINNKIIKYNSSGEIVGEINQHLKSPSGVAINAAGDRVYIANTENYKIHIYDNDLRLLRTLTGYDVYEGHNQIKLTYWTAFFADNRDYSSTYKSLSEGFNRPTDVILDNADNLIVVDCETSRILKYTKEGDPLYFGKKHLDLKGEFNSYTYNDWWETSHLNGTECSEFWVKSNQINDKYRYELWPSGSFSAPYHIYGYIGADNGTFAYPYSAVVDTWGNLYVTDTGNNRIEKFSSDGIYVASYGGTYLKTPKGIAVDMLGNIWVADSGNKRILHIDSAGNIIKSYKSEDYDIDPYKIIYKQGKLYIADANRDKPLIWNVAGYIANITIKDSAFSPNGDGKMDANKISYSLSQPAKVTIQAINSTGEVVGTITSDSSRNIGMNEEVWDGSIDTPSGRMTIAGGSYTLKIIASFGDYIKSASVSVIVDTIPPTIQFACSEKAISPNGDGVQDSAMFSYNLTDDYSATLEAQLKLKKNNAYVHSIWDDVAWQRWGKLGEDLSVKWDGRIGEIRYVSQGKYLCELKATDQAGNTATATCEVAVDIDSPKIENITADNPYFSPNNDGRKDSASLNYHLSDNLFKDAKITAVLYNNSGQVLYHIKDLEKTPIGEQSINWDGRAGPSSSGVLTDGKYSIRLWAFDEAGNMETKTLTEINIDTVPPTIQALSVSPNPFTPNNDGVKDTADFNYKLSEPCFADLRIFREDGVQFRNIGLYNIENNSWTWDGKGARGELLGGPYTYYLYAEDRAANITTSEVKTVLVDREPSLIPYCYAEPDPFSPVSQNNKFTDIKYWVSRDNVQVQVSVLGKEGQIIKNLVFGETQNKGEHNARWYGDFIPGYDGPKADSDTTKVADGAYTFKVWAYDPYNLARGDNSNTVMADNTAPYLAIYPVEVDQVQRTATLRYYLPEIATVEVAAYDEGGVLTETVIDRERQLAGEYYMPWQVGNRSPGKTYFMVAAEDSAKNRDIKTTELFTIDPESPLAVSNASCLPTTFTPNSDGINDQARISYRLSGGVAEYRVDINILNSSGATIKRLLVNEPQNTGTYNFYWNGKIDSPDPSLATVAADGHYSYQIIATDRLGVRVEANGPFTLVATKPQVTLSANPIYLSPNGDGIADRSVLTYGIDYPAAWVENPARVRLDIVNSSGEAVFTKQFVQTPGSYTYEWDNRDGGDLGSRLYNLPAGYYYAYVSATDGLGTSAIPASSSLYLDYSDPLPSNFNITPSYAKLGRQVNIDLKFTETLAETPTVSIVMPDSSLRPLSLQTVSEETYNCSYTILSGDIDGVATVRVEARDIALNPILQTKTFVIDKTNPVISNITISPNPAKVGNAYIDFKVNEELGGAAVLVKQNGASALYAPLANLGSGNFRATYSVFSGYDGPASVTIEVSDLAGNPSSFTPSGVEGLIVDTTSPVFTSLSCQVDNPDFSTYAKEGSVVTMSFKSSELLAVNPDVKMNGRPATYDLGPVTGNEYRYKYTIKNDEVEGLATLTIAGYDPAWNLGEKATSEEAESFRIDLTNPTVAIAAPGSADIIASPSPFFTNADPEDAQDRPNYTTLRYGISEYGYVTLKVHKIPNDKVLYSKGDFTDQNVVATLIPGNWMNSGIYNNEWRGLTTVASFDANLDGYADPGKYAFIVEVKDRAGNITQRKWGGTVWIQNNVIDLVQPETVGINPDPLNFSPNGNSPLISTKFWFKALLSVTPEAVLPPERIEAMGIPETKKVGTYTVKVYDAGGAWIRTIAKDRYMYSATDTFEVWDGKAGNGTDKLTPGAYIADGNYRLSIELKDFTGNPANNSPLDRWVKVDSALPTITNNQPGDNTWRNASGTDYNVDLTDNGSRLQDASYKIIRPDTSQSSWISLPVMAGSASFTDNWTVDWAQCAEGENKVTVKVKDIAGNESLQDNIFYVRKDTVKPANPTLSINGGNPYTNSASVNLSASVVEGTSGIAEMQVRNSDGSYVHFTANPWILSGSDGAKTVYVKMMDNAGNWSDETSDTIVLDTTSPSISPPTDSSFNPYLGNLNLNFNLSDSTSGMSSINAQIEKMDGTRIKSLSVGAGDPGYSHKVVWDGTNDAIPEDYVNEGSYRLRIVASDIAGNSITPNSECDINLWDDQAISSGGIYVPESPPAMTNPYMTRTGNNLTLQWLQGENIHSLTETARASGGVLGPGGYQSDCKNFYADRTQNVTVTTAADDGIQSWHAVWRSTGPPNYNKIPESYQYVGTIQIPVPLWSSGSRGTVATLSLPSNYYIVEAVRQQFSGNGSSQTQVSYSDQKYKQFTRTSPDLGRNWSDYEYLEVDSYPTGNRYIFDPEPVLVMEGTPPLIIPVFVYAVNTKIYYIYRLENNLVYRKGTIIQEYRSSFMPVINPASIPSSNISWSPVAQITHTNSVYQTSLSVCKDTSENVYVAWQDARNQLDRIYFQKIPYNFAPTRGTVTALISRNPVSDKIVASATPEAPSLVEPVDGVELKTTRPAFKWKAPKNTYTEYSVKWAQLPNAEGDGKATKNNTSGSEKPAELGILYFGHQVDDHFDTALERNKTYFWKVVGKKADGTEIQSNNIYSFTCNPPLELQGITNYPNPFDPTREKTKIRYKLTKDADEVTIRIYDITGALVNELTGTPFGESLNLWTKFNDIEWDGRNGRGDLVMNGIYPFEVVARLGSASVSGRGKIAVLK